MGLTSTSALDCFHSDDLIGIGMEADAVRRRLHPENVVTYALDGRILCSASTSPDDLTAAATKIADHGGTAVLLELDRSSTLPPLAWFEALFLHVKTGLPGLWLETLSASTVLSLAETSGLTVADTLMRLRDAGLDSIPGHDAGILDDSVHLQPARPGCSAQAWLDIHRTAHTLGIRTTASMTFGAGESPEHRIHHLEVIRALQHETGGFAAFTPIPAQPLAAVPGFEEATAVEYLKTVAISRIWLDNITNIQSSLSSQGLKVLQVALRFGSNDAGSILQASGPTAATEEQVRYAIRDAGFKPAQRDTLYRTIYLN